MDYVWPIVFALFLWWFSTGAIFFLDSLPRHTFKWSMLGGTALLLAAFVCLWRTAGDRSVMAVYAAFSSAVVAWGWQELSLYTGYVTGPRKHACQTGCAGLRHFGHAILANLWHELAIIVCAGVVVYLTWNAANHVGVLTFLMLWFMHLSARLNVFLGVRNVSEEFVPEHMAVLKSFLTRRPMNLLFPFSVTAAAILTAVLFMLAFDASDDVTRTGYLMLGALAALGLIEHWLLMVPLPVEKLFAWSLKPHRLADRHFHNTHQRAPGVHPPLTVAR
jgi:putative photosynthetic complex assembly protein 2